MGKTVTFEVLIPGQPNEYRNVDFSDVADEDLGGAIGSALDDWQASLDDTGGGGTVYLVIPG